MGDNQDITLARMIGEDDTLNCIPVQAVWELHLRAILNVFTAVPGQAGRDLKSYQRMNAWMSWIS